MNNLAFVFLGLALAFGGMKLWNTFWSFKAQKLQDYTISTDRVDLATALGKRFEAHGVIFDYTGRVKSRFIAEINGTFDAQGGSLKERFSYSAGTSDTREWAIKFKADGQSFTATAPDVIGEAEGKLQGDALRMTYRLQLPERVGGHVLDVVDWLYLMEDGAIVNRSEMRKFGIKAAELVAVFRAVAETSAKPIVATK